MSMHEALSRLRGVVPWLSDQDEQVPDTPAPLTALEEVEELVRLAKTVGYVEKSSPTWQAVAGWAAQQVIELRARPGNEVNDARIMLLLDLLRLDGHAEPRSVTILQDQGPFIP